MSCLLCSITKSIRRERKEIDVYKLLRIHREYKPEQVAIVEFLLTIFASLPLACVALRFKQFFKQFERERTVISFPGSLRLRRRVIAASPLSICSALKLLKKPPSHAALVTTRDRIQFFYHAKFKKYTSFEY